MPCAGILQRRLTCLALELWLLRSFVEDQTLIQVLKMIRYIFLNGFNFGWTLCILPLKIMVKLIILSIRMRSKICLMYATYNGISFKNSDTPIRLADLYKVKGTYKFGFPSQPLEKAPRVANSIINGTYKGFIEIVLVNNDTVVQTFHLDGYSFFVVGMGFGEWSENNRGSYNRWDAISRSTVQETDIARHVNRLRKHHSDEVHRLVKLLVRLWTIGLR